jgi:hypothetical protein
LQDGKCVFLSVSQNWPTAEPSFQETGLHLPPDHSKRTVRGLVDLSVRTVQLFGFRRGVLHGPDSTCATVLAELTLSGKNLRHARWGAAQVLRDPPRILPA